MGVDGGGGRGSSSTEAAVGMWQTGSSGSSSQPCPSFSVSSGGSGMERCPHHHTACLIPIHDLGLVLASDSEAGAVT